MDSDLSDDKTISIAPPRHMELPQRIGRYHIETLLGQGGSGYVLRALDPVLHRTVAIKVLNPALAAHPDARAQFLREARAVASLKDDNIVPIYTAEEEAGVTYLVMEYVPGGTLAARLQAARSLRGAEILSIARQVTRGLAVAHAAGLVHGDIKPSNILLETAPAIPLTDTAPSPGDWYRAKIADFGLVQLLTDSGMADPATRAGTPGFMSPEQINGTAVDCRSDLYSLGALLYQMVTGRPPFVAVTRNALLHLQLSSQPLPPSQVAPGLELGPLEPLILQLLQRDPAARPQTVAAVARVLENFAGENLLSPEERARLSALRRYRLLDTDPETPLNDLTYLASYVCGTPIALISLIDEDRQWFKANIGLPVQQTARNISFCTHTIRQADPLLVPDATQDWRFADNPLVRSDPNIRFYAGIPLLTIEGYALGSLCVIDRIPRQLSPEQQTALTTISRLIQEHLELRRTLLEVHCPSTTCDADDMPTCFPDRPSTDIKTDDLGK